MNYIHYEINAGPNNIVQTTLDKQAYVRLMDYSNYQNYRQGSQYRFFGGLATTSPYNIRPPHQGQWNLVIDLGGYSGTVHASVQVI